MNIKSEINRKFSFQGTPTAITITGSGFDALNITNNIVLIGTTACVITSATTTQLVCAPGDNLIIKDF